MTVTEPVVYAWMVAIVSALFGLFVGHQTVFKITEAERAKHKAQTDEMWEEIQRLRAQNAMLIGKE